MSVTELLKDAPPCECQPYHTCETCRLLTDMERGYWSAVKAVVE